MTQGKAVKDSNGAKRVSRFAVCFLFCLVLCLSGSAAPVSLRTVTAPVIIDRPVRLTEIRERLTREYAVKHFGTGMTEIVPRAVIVHWTESPEADGVYAYFYKEAMADGTLNVCSQFLVDRDGTIFRLTPETMLDRHAIGYNWCAIGIENVGGVDRKEDLTAAQLQANLALIRYLQAKYPTLRYVWGHYQQTQAKASGLFKEKVEGYFHGKVDPGPKFMKALRERLKDTGLRFFEP
ncbi:MAG: N-acetylmuramoyl-L-alanine amidase [Acidaminococcaceae bacterium]|nr:N-acetylmuramoyl-L-alanine amidase [Acidaminococcaceae bacterium]MBO6039350.1 N-acetylmuramoyl-L-alanine amidase [Acidaminococcaceae bacterium]